MLSTQTVAKISRFLLYVIAVLPLVLWPGFTFPYVTIRTSLFRVLVEIVVVLVLLLWAGGRVQFKGFKRQYFF